MAWIRKLTRPTKVTSAILKSSEEEDMKTSILKQALQSPSQDMTAPLKTSIQEQTLQSPSASVIVTPAVKEEPKELKGTEKPSQKFLQLQKKRKEAYEYPILCPYTFSKGPKKGEQCGKVSVICEMFCRKHLSKKALPNKLTPSSADGICKMLRINRLKKGKRYFFVRRLANYTVKLICDGVHYILRLPMGMEHPERISKGHYLIRNSDGSTLWRQAPKCTTL